MERVDHLNKHLNNLVALNQQDGSYIDEINDTILEIKKELGIGAEQVLSTYSTAELRRELLSRKGVHGIAVSSEQEALLTVTTGEHDEKAYIKGPSLVLIVQD